MAKKSIGLKLQQKPAPSTADEFVKAAGAAGQEKPAEPMQRLTLDLPEDLHTRIKVACALMRPKRTMAEVLREILEREFPPKG